KEEAETQPGESVTTPAQANEPSPVTAPSNETEVTAKLTSSDNTAPLVVVDSTQTGAETITQEPENVLVTADINTSTPTNDLALEAAPSHESFTEVEETKVAEAKAKIKKPKKK